jgi:hypothetical protein
MEEIRAEQRRIINNSPIIQSRRDNFITNWFKTVTEIILQWIIIIN